MEGSVGEVLMLLVDLGEHDWGHADLGLEGSLLGVLLIRNLGDSGGGLGGVDESHDVRVVLEDEDLLGGGFIISGRSDSDNRSLSNMWELELESKGVESLTGGISELELVSVFIELEDLEDLGDNVEVS